MPFGAMIDHALINFPDPNTYAHALPGKSLDTLD